MAAQVPSKEKIQSADSATAKIKAGLVKLATMLKGSRQKLLDMKSRIVTAEQKQKYAALAKAQIALENEAKSRAQMYKVLTDSMGKLKSMFGAIVKGATATALSVWDTAKKPVSWLMSKLKKNPASVKGIGSINDLGVAPVVIWAAVAATIMALSAAVGHLLAQANTQQKQIDALNDDIDYYVQQERGYEVDEGNYEPSGDEYYEEE